MPVDRPAVRYRFGAFTLSPRRRLLLHNGTVVPLIPRYFDLLRLMIDRRHEALDRREIFDCVWADVVVSDSALSQAVRTLRRALGDDPRTPRYIRTVSRHGYQFVFEPIVAEEDDAPAQEERPPAFAEATAGKPDATPEAAPQAAPLQTETQIPALLDRLLAAPSMEERREAAEQLHALGTREALAQLGTRPGHARARALLRETRWDVAGAGDVPLLGQPDALTAATALMGLRVQGAARAAASRLGLASAGGAIAGAVAGVIGGAVLMLPADSAATFSTMTALVIIAGLAGAFGAATIGAGLASAEVLARSRRRLALAVCGAVSGLIAGSVARVAVDAVFGSIMGRSPEGLGGPLEGLVIGFAAGAGYAWSTRTPAGGGLASPTGVARLTAALGTAVCCAVAAAALTAAGGRTVAVVLDTLGHTYDGSQLGLGALARALGENEMRPVTRALASAFEGLMFGFGLAAGLTHRPVVRSS